MTIRPVSIPARGAEGNFEPIRATIAALGRSKTCKPVCRCHLKSAGCTWIQRSRGEPDLGLLTASAYDGFVLPLPERSLISRISAAAGKHVFAESGQRGVRQSHSAKTGNLVTGIGDDCAVLRLPSSHDLLTTTDFSLEGVHFRREWHSPESVSHRCLARGLSDIAAMGGEPIAAFLSLALPRKLPQSWVDSFMKGLLNLAREFGVPLAGGDTAESPSGILADVVVLGSVPKGTAVLRSGAHPGDRIYVTGELGGSAAALNLLSSKRRKLVPRQFAKHFFPEPRIKQGHFLRAKNIASSMIDISDGLSTDLSHICEESGVGAEIWAETIPAATIGRPPKPVDPKLALHGGEDYELLFTARPEHRVPAQISGTPVTCIGEITRGKQVSLIDEAGTRVRLQPRGWEHFRHQ